MARRLDSSGCNRVSRPIAAVAMIVMAAILGMANWATAQSPAAGAVSAGPNGGGKVDTRTGTGPHKINCPDQRHVTVELPHDGPPAIFKLEGCYCGSKDDVTSDLKGLSDLKKLFDEFSFERAGDEEYMKSFQKRVGDLGLHLENGPMKKTSLTYEYEVDPPPGKSTQPGNAWCVSEPAVKSYLASMLNDVIGRALGRLVVPGI